MANPISNLMDQVIHPMHLHFRVVVAALALKRLICRVVSMGRRNTQVEPDLH
jgi:hypothetical protein